MPLFSSFSHHNYITKKRRCCAWDANAGHRTVGAKGSTELRRSSLHLPSCSVTFACNLQILKSSHNFNSEYGDCFNDIVLTNIGTEGDDDLSTWGLISRCRFNKFDKFFILLNKILQVLWYRPQMARDGSEVGVFDQGGLVRGENFPIEWKFRGGKNNSRTFAPLVWNYF